MEEAGAAAVVLPSLFEEQLERDQLAIRQLVTVGPGSFAETLARLPELDVQQHRAAGLPPPHQAGQGSPVDPGDRQHQRLGRRRLDGHARLMEEPAAGPELNIYFVPTDPDADADAVESRYVDIVAAVAEATTIPVAVKLGPYFSSLPNLARAAATAAWLVLFNRYLQPESTSIASGSPPTWP